MSKKTSEKKNKPPEISPYVFPALLAGFGLWCFYDGWLTSNIEMQEHALFNQVLSVVLLPWAGIDFFKVRKSERNHKENNESEPGE
jgi:hypothetical protein